MMGAFKDGVTPCVNAAAMSPASESCITAATLTRITGFTESLLAMHISGGIGDVTNLVRDPDDIRTTGKNLIASVGPGESSYTLYDRQAAAAAQIWLRETGTRRHAHPWVLFVSMVAPHFPLTAPPEHYYRYIGQDLPRPKLYDEAERPEHAYVRMYARRSELRHAHQRPGRLAASLGRVFFGLVSFLDEQIGRF
jgi:choline-sulfatase